MTDYFSQFCRIIRSDRIALSVTELDENGHENKWFGKYFQSTKNLYYNIQNLFVCVSVWTFIGSAPGHDRDLRPVSLEPEWPKWKLLKKMTSGQITEVKVMLTMLFYRKFFQMMAIDYYKDFLSTTFTEVTAFTNFLGVFLNKFS
jgi:hypothetical protein